MKCKYCKKKVDLLQGEFFTVDCCIDCRGVYEKELSDKLDFFDMKNETEKEEK